MRLHQRRSDKDSHPNSSYSLERLEPCHAPVIASEVTRRAKSTATSYLSIFRHLHNKKYEEKSLFSAEFMFERRAPCVMTAGNLFQVETIHFIGGKTLHLPGRTTNED